MVARTVRSSTGAVTSSCRNAWSTRRPSILGRRMSRMIRSCTRVSAMTRPSSPSAATSTAYPSSSRPFLMKLATFFSSSTTRIRTGDILTVGRELASPQVVTRTARSRLHHTVSTYGHSPWNAVSITRHPEGSLPERSKRPIIAAVVIIPPPDDHLEGLRLRGQRDQHIDPIDRCRSLLPLADRQIHAPDRFGPFLQPGDKGSPVGGIGEKGVRNHRHLARLSAK